MYQPANVKTNLHNREECPRCKHVFIRGFGTDSEVKCPSCAQKFTAGQKINNNCVNNDYSGSNNVYYKDGCPAIMSDGRFITNYGSTNELTETMRKLNGIKSPNEFRNFMQKNGDLFMDSERKYITEKNTCSPATACSQGWHDLWAKNNGNWANGANVPKAFNE